MYNLKDKDMKLDLSELIIPKRVANSPVRTTFFNENLLINPSSEFAYLLGYFWADGYISEKDNIVLEIVSEDAYSIKPIIDTLGTFSFNDRKRERRKDCCKRKPQTSIYLSNTNFSKFLRKMDYQYKSVRSFEKVFSFLSVDLQKYFIRGFVDGDGCIHVLKSGRGKQISIASTYEQDWDFFLHYMKTFNVDFKLTRKVQSPTSKSSAVRITSKANIDTFFSTFYKEDGVYLKRKYSKFLQISK